MFVQVIIVDTILVIVNGVRFKIDLTTNQCHRSNWPVGEYQVEGFPFSRTFFNYRTTFQLPSMVKHQLD